MTTQLNYPGSWRHPIPLHPAFSIPLPRSPKQSRLRGSHPSMVMIYTAEENQLWVAADRRWATLQFATGSVLTKGTLKPDPQRCHILEAASVHDSFKVLVKHKLVPPKWPVWKNTQQPRVLIAQAWLDWDWICAHHPLGSQLKERSVAWWSEIYQVKLSIRTIERYKELMRFHARQLTDVVWGDHLTVSQALSFAKLCPQGTIQKDMINRYGFEDFAQRFIEGRLPVDGLLARRVEHHLNALDNPTDDEMVKAIEAAISEWRASLAIEQPAHPRPNPVRRRGRYVPGTMQKY